MGSEKLRLLYRVVALVCLGIVLGLSIAVVKTNTELNKVLPAGNLRNILMLAGPFAALVLTGFNLTGRSRRLSSLWTEALIVLIGYCGFLLVALPHFYQKMAPSGNACRWFSFRCIRESLVPNFWLSTPVIAVAFLLLWALYRREFR